MELQFAETVEWSLAPLKRILTPIYIAIVSWQLVVEVGIHYTGTPEKIGPLCVHNANVNRPFDSQPIGVWCDYCSTLSWVFKNNQMSPFFCFIHSHRGV